MQITVKGKGTQVTDSLRDYAEKKIGKLAEFFNNIQKAEVTLDVHKIADKFKSQVAEVTVWTSGKMVRAADGAADMYAAIDQVFDKLERQIEKHKEKLQKESRRIGEKTKEKLREAFGAELVAKEPVGPVVVKVKRFAMTPLTPEEAAEEMELLGHDFFMFHNSKTNEINTIYRRRTGNYGLIEPELK